MRAVVFLLLVALAWAKENPTSFGILESEGHGYGPENVTQHSGYIAVDKAHNYGGHIFYWLFESRNDPKNDPLVLWMTGGPGCSSELAIFSENGPYRVNNDDLSITSNDGAWNSVANVLFVDQPVGTGFSYADNSREYVSSETQVAQDMFEFLQTFFETYPQYAGLDFYVTGESYAGHYVPAVSNRIHQGNVNKEGKPINLKGLAIGNGLVNPGIQYGEYHNFAFANGLITESQRDSLNSSVSRCQWLIKKNWNTIAMIQCNLILSKIQSIAGNFNVYDVRKKCDYPPLCYDMSGIDKLMARKDVQQSLGVDPSKSKWSECSTVVHTDLMKDWLLNCEVFLPPLLDANIRVLVYAGVEDFICNYMGNRDWVNAMEWSGSSGFAAAPTKPWSAKDGSTAGHARSFSGLTFLEVAGAGHLVPHDQPENALDMLTRFIKNTPFA